MQLPSLSTCWTVRHETQYLYDVPVVFSPHRLRLNPLPGRGRLISRHLEVEPVPTKMEEELDSWGNCCTRLEFGSDPGQRLRIVSRFAIELLPLGSFDGLALSRLPWSVSRADDLAAYRAQGELPLEVVSFAQGIASEVAQAPIPFLDRLCQTLFARTDKRIRQEGAANSAVETLASARGACRDLTVLFMAVCQAVGMACRFVSGYQARESTVDGQRHLHAWPEVLLPGFGWQGWDPMYGIRVGGAHIALCAGPEQGATMPVEGGFTFVGPTVNSTLKYAISLEELR